MLSYFKDIPYTGKVWRGEEVGELTCFEHLVKKVCQINRSANRLLIISTNLDGFSLVNCGQFAKFATKLSRYTVLIKSNVYEQIIFKKHWFELNLKTHVKTNLITTLDPYHTIIFENG